MRKALLLTSMITFLSCAVMKPPEGGPKDETPPRVIDISPQPGSSGVDRASPIRITFSEKIDGDSFKKLIQVYPPLEFGRIGAKGEAFEISFKEELPETTICVVIRKGYTDQHRVKAKKGIEFCFSTADSIDTGSISGQVLFKMAPDSTGLAKLVAVDPVMAREAETHAPLGGLCVEDVLQHTGTFGDIDRIRVACLQGVALIKELGENPKRNVGVDPGLER